MEEVIVAKGHRSTKGEFSILPDTERKIVEPIYTTGVPGDYRMVVELEFVVYRKVYSKEEQELFKARRGQTVRPKSSISSFIPVSETEKVKGKLKRIRGKGKKTIERKGVYAEQMRDAYVLFKGLYKDKPLIHKGDFVSYLMQKQNCKTVKEALNMISSLLRAGRIYEVKTDTYRSLAG